MTVDKLGSQKPVIDKSVKPTKPTGIELTEEDLGHAAGGMAASTFRKKTTEEKK